MKERLIKGLPATLFLLVVISQLFFVRTAHLPPWHGGGFGMFATIDREISRRLQIHGFDHRGKVYRIAFSSQKMKSQWILRDRVRGLEIFPHPGRLQSFAQDLLKKEYVLAGERERYVLNQSPANSVFFTDRRKEITDYLQPIKPYEKVEDKSKVIKLQKIEISDWRPNFDQRTHQISWEQVGESVQVSV